MTHDTPGTTADPEDTMTAQDLVDAYRSVDADALRAAGKNPYFEQIAAVEAAIDSPVPPAWMDGSYLSRELHAELAELDPPKNQYLDAECASAIGAALKKVRRGDKSMLFRGRVATGDADAATAEYIVSALTRAIKASTLTNGGAVQTRSHKPHGKRATPAMIHLSTAAEGWAFPIGAGKKHMLAADAKSWQWQESPDESDVSGTVDGFAGPKLDAAAAGRHNAARARTEMAKAAAAAALQATLGEPVPDGLLPAASHRILDARPQSQFGGRLSGTIHYVTPDGRYATAHHRYDMPSLIAVSDSPVDAAIIAAGLGIDADTIPAPAQSTPTATATAIVAGGLLMF